MGFNKKFIDDSVVSKWIENGLNLENLFDADCLIIQGEGAKKIYELFSNKNVDEETLKKVFLEYKIN